MAHKPSRYEQSPKWPARSNRVILGVHAAAQIFWGFVALLGVAIVGALYWLLTHGLGP